MKKISVMKITIIAAVALAITACQSTSDEPQVSPDGMQLKVSTRSTIAYKKEDVNFSEYTKVLILPSQVAFKKNWQRDYNRDRARLSTHLSDKDVLRIKTDVAKLFDEIFTEELVKGNENILVDKAGTGVLLIRPAIIDLDVNAPDTMSANRDRTYVSEAGEATLFLELYDSVSGEILARIMDNQAVGDNHYARVATRLGNTADMKRAIRKWAKALKAKYEQNQFQQ